MTTAVRIAYVKPTDPEMFKLGTHALKALAAGKGKPAGAAKQELERRALNRAAKKGGRS